jgi:hypothetical protein
VTWLSTSASPLSQLEPIWHVVISCGKSLYANFQVGASDLNVFSIGHGHDPATKGLWIAFAERKDHVLCVIDSEGLAGALRPDGVRTQPAGPASEWA